MLRASRYPSLYQVNTRVRLRQLGEELGLTATLDDLPDAELDRLAEVGFEWVWFLGVRQTGEAGKGVSLSREDWHRLPRF